MDEFFLQYNIDEKEYNELVVLQATNNIDRVIKCLCSSNFTLSLAASFKLQSFTYEERISGLVGNLNHPDSGVRSRCISILRSDMKCEQDLIPIFEERLKVETKYSVASYLQDVLRILTKKSYDWPLEPKLLKFLKKVKMQRYFLRFF